MRPFLTISFGLATLLGGCATGPTAKNDGSGASVLVEVENDHGARPGQVRLAAADYTIDGVSVLSLRPRGPGVVDVPDRGNWSGAVPPGEHVLEATLSYPPRTEAGDDMAIAVHETFRFRSARGDVVRIRVAESVADTGLTASLDKKLGVRIVRF